MRYGPCCGCGKGIPWEDQYCSECERKQSHEEQLISDREEVAAMHLILAHKQGWRTNGSRDEIQQIIHICPGCTKKYDSNWLRKLVTDDFHSILNDYNEPHLTLNCAEEDCETFLTAELPVLSESDLGD